MRYVEFLSERPIFPKKSWEILISNSDKIELSDELITLVQNAYKNTNLGSFVNSVKEVLPSDWVVMNWDDDPELDAVIFYRVARENEPWRGHKIQGIGHDNQTTSKKYIFEKIENLLKNRGWWIESSDAMRPSLKKINALSISDHDFLKKLFNDEHLTMIDDDTYKRKLPNGDIIVETVFGNPILKSR
jgi:hypothetical protein